jgi:hypothetical protein
VLQRGGADRDPDHGAHGDPHAAPGLAQDRAQEHPGRLQVGDDAVLQRPDRDEPGRGPAEEVGRLLPDGEDPVPAGASAAQQHDGRFVEDDAAADIADDGVGGAQIDAEFHPEAS